MLIFSVTEACVTVACTLPGVCSVRMIASGSKLEASKSCGWEPDTRELKIRRPGCCGVSPCEVCCSVSCSPLSKLRVTLALKLPLPVFSSPFSSSWGFLRLSTSHRGGRVRAEVASRCWLVLHHRG